MTHPEIRNVSILYADLIGFSKIAKIFEPDDMMAFLNRLFSVMEAPIEEHDGVIDKIIGDGIMISFNAFKNVGNHQEKAVRTALAIINAVQNFSKELEQPVFLGIGIASGKASCGPLGTPKYFTNTVIGQVVGKAVSLGERGCSEESTTLLVDSSIFHETISTFEYRQIEEDIFKVSHLH